MGLSLACDLWVRVSMQTEDPPEPTNPTRIDPSRSGWHLRRVGDGSQTVRTDSGGSSGGFRPQGTEPPDLPDKSSKNDENHLDPATIWRFSALIQPRLGFLYSNQLKSGQDLASSLLKYAKFRRTNPDLLKLRQNSSKPDSNSDKSSQIFIDPKESHPTSIRSGQISAKNKRIGKPETDRFPPKNRYDPTRLIWNFRRVGCGSKSSPPDNVGSSPGWAQTRPDLTRGHPYLWVLRCS